MIKTSCRLALTLSFIAGSVLWIAHGLNLVPDVKQEKTENRLQQCESLGVSTAWLASQNSVPGIQEIINEIGGRSDDLKSIGVFYDKEKVAEYGSHQDFSEEEKLTSDSTQISLEILANGKPWGEIQIVFQPLEVGLVGWLTSPFMTLILFTTGLFGLLSWILLSRSFKYLDPSRVVPSRVRSALDVMAEGLILQDHLQQIVMVNESFSKMVDRKVGSLVGGSPDIFSWVNLDESRQDRFPWIECLEKQAPLRGWMLGLETGKSEQKKYIVNSMPITEENGKCRGVLTSFEDVTALENKRVELSRMLNVLQASQEEIRRKNDDLEYLASRDSLTGCLNRRAFFGLLEQMWADTTEGELSVVMLDIDFFKSVNDDFGHALGDSVIKSIANTIMEIVGDLGSVCRYGGEEFCVALPEIGYELAVETTELIRETISNNPIEKIDVTLSIGVSSRRFLAMDPQHILEQADQSLYQAKRLGRNRVVGFEECSTLGIDSERQSPDASFGDTADFISPVEHPAVLASLFSTLYCRSKPLAMHCSRVANLASNLIRPHVSEATARVVETAAFLHDLGKIGFTQQQLGHSLYEMEPNDSEHTREHFKATMNLCRSALVSPDVATIVANYSAAYADGAGYKELDQTRPRLALACRVLHVCKAFDSMINAENFRMAKSFDDALKYLQERSPAVFDPDIVEALVDMLKQNRECLTPIHPEGSVIDVVAVDDTQMIVESAQSGGMQPMRSLMKRLRREALSEDPSIQTVIEKLEESLDKSDQELNELFETAQQLLEICRSNRKKRQADGDFQVMFE